MKKNQNELLWGSFFVLLGIVFNLSHYGDILKHYSLIPIVIGIFFFGRYSVGQKKIYHLDDFKKGTELEFVSFVYEENVAGTLVVFRVNHCFFCNVWLESFEYRLLKEKPKGEVFILRGKRILI